MTLSTTTVIVLTANSITAVLAAGLLMLVLWQAPHRRANQLFALTMLMLGVYSGVNGFGRFVGDLDIDPEPVFILAYTLYGAFVVAIFFFASEFTQAHTTTVHFMRGAGVILLVIDSALMWSGRFATGVQPIDSHDGGYKWDMTPLGIFATFLVVIYLGATAIVLYRIEDERGRRLWVAPMLVIASALSAMLIWPVVPVPLNALFLAAAAMALGLPVLRYELFNPLADLNAQLAEKNVDLERANQLKSQFLANMSHELRTPLNSIIGYTELALNGTYGGLNDTQRDRLEKVVRNGYDLLTLINDVLDLNKIEAGQVVLERRDIATANLLNNIAATIEPLAAQKGLAIHRDYAGAPPIYADEIRIQQIMTNIASNAVKFTHEGSVTLRACRVENMVQLEVIDTGIGITPGQEDVVFAEFEQVDSSTTRQYGGTGLGMAISKKLVEMHGGRIWLESTPGQGTTFFVQLPAADPISGVVIDSPAPVAEQPG
ncbi:MAG: hypothetical protein JXJ20_00825 [Anaerolineae bacterium]|jgi:signal transduction histidine kinase|nr:hypothetical protein [Anaerolineae bacterium]